MPYSVGVSASRCVGEGVRSTGVCFATATHVVSQDCWLGKQAGGYVSRCTGVDCALDNVTPCVCGSHDGD